MKKFAALIFALIFAASAVSFMAFADNPDDAATTKRIAPTVSQSELSTFDYKTTAVYPETTVDVDAKLICDFCGAQFRNEADLKAHLAATFLVPNHEMECGNKLGDECCHEIFTSKAALAAHQAECKYVDRRSDFDKMKDAISEGDYMGALKAAVDFVVAFVQSDEFRNIVNKVVDAIKNIDIDAVIGTVKDIAGKLPLDKIADLF